MVFHIDDRRLSVDDKLERVFAVGIPVRDAAVLRFFLIPILNVGRPYGNVGRTYNA
jgi:hypothetical protein